MVCGEIVGKGSPRRKQHFWESNTLFSSRNLEEEWKGGCQQGKVLLGQGQAPGSGLSAAQNTHSSGKSQELQQGLPLGQGSALWPGLSQCSNSRNTPLPK